MELTLTNKQHLDLATFCSWLLPKLQEELLGKINNFKCKQRDQVIQNKGIIQYVGTKRQVPTQTLLKQAILSIRWKKLPNASYQFYINKAKTIYGSSTTIDTVARLIEYGTEGVSPMPIFRNVFEEFAKNAQEWYNQYEMGVS